VLIQENIGDTQPHLFVLSIILENSHRGKLSHLGGNAVGRHLVRSKIDHSQKVYKLHVKWMCVACLCTLDE